MMQQQSRMYLPLTSQHDWHRFLGILYLGLFMYYDKSIFTPTQSHCIHNTIQYNTQHNKMDENIDLANIQSIPHHEMLAITNQYMIGCADHINKVADFAQKQMMDIDSLIDNLDNQVLILQAKLGINQPAKLDN